MISKSLLQKLAREHGTPLFVVDHDALRKNYREFRKYLPRVQVYFAVKANPLPEIVRTFFLEGASFDVASMPEFNIVYDNIKGMSPKARQEWIWDKIIYANPNKPVETLEELNQYKPLVTFDNAEELLKIKERGFALDEGEAVTGIRCVGAAILGADGKPVAALSISGPMVRVTKDRLPVFATELRKAVRDISARLGYRMPKSAEVGQRRMAEPTKRSASSRVTAK